MDTAKLRILSVSALLLSPIAAQAAEKPEKPATDLRQEVTELRQLVSDVAVRLEKMERRLARLEERIKLPVQAIWGRWRLDSRRTVDRRGVIWQDGRSVGVWGIDSAGPRGVPR